MNYPAQVLNDTLGAQQELVRHFVDYGFAYYVEDFVKTPWRKSFTNTSRHANNKLLRAAARELKRPFVFATLVRYKSWGTDVLCERRTITTPKQERCAPLIAPLLLPSTDMTRRWDTAEHVVGHRKDGTNHYFYFNTTNGVKLFDDWLELARTTPEMRRALRVQ